MFAGKGQFNGNDFTFKGPIEDFKLWYALGKKYNHDHDYEANIFEEQPFVLKLNSQDLSVEGTDIGESGKTELTSLIEDNLLRIKREVQDANKETLKDFPMDLAVPFVFMFYTTQFSQDIRFNN